MEKQEKTMKFKVGGAELIAELSNARGSRSFVIPKQTIQRASYRFLNDSVHARYLNHVIENYDNPLAKQHLMGLSSEDGEISYTTPFRLIALQESGLLGEERLATEGDLSNVGRYFPPGISKERIDSGILLRDFDGHYTQDQQSAKISAKNLITQLRDLNIDFKTTEPGKRPGFWRTSHYRFLPYRVLTQEENTNSPTGLILSLKEGVSKEELSEISHPQFLYCGPQTERKFGLPRTARLEYHTDFGKFYQNALGDFSDSDSCSRVLVVSNGELTNKAK
ncbi:hypothetical protein HOA55_01975 [archaeon]|jgi:hypothetical protein|nr:hypothetical protein [archaeon]MBT6820099.1 hypothetical protein [archaeon]MBT7025380.1 hypothetical protein [archaeon]MBT7568151.1 hypothetical protein [archaeon]MBT7705967.1 hypothetical protein [archaeon]